MDKGWTGSSFSKNKSAHVYKYKDNKLCFCFVLFLFFLFLLYFRCILAGLSGDFRLCLFSQYSSTFDWHKVRVLKIWDALHAWVYFYNVLGFGYSIFHQITKFGILMLKPKHYKTLITIDWYCY